jgi:O-antigen/teichoic acid export membrane protein
LLIAVFGPAFVVSLHPMYPLFAGQLINAGVGMAGALLIVDGKEGRLVVFTAASVMVNAALSVILIPRMGIMGAAIANMAAMILWNVSIWAFALRTMRIDTSFIGWAKP